MNTIIIILSAFLALTISTAQEQNSVAEKEESNVPATFLSRDVREPGKRRKHRTRQRKNNNNVKPSRRKGRKGKGNGNGNGNGRKKTINTNPKDRQTDTCFADLVAKLKKFNTAQTNNRMVMRIGNWNGLLKNKKNSSGSTFKDSLEAMVESTGNGTACGGGGMDSESKAVFDKLKDCAKTAGDNCDASKMTNPVNETLVAKCGTILTTFTKAFKECLAKATDAEQCSCVQGLTDPDKECLAFKDMSQALKEQKKKCTGGDAAGSFGDCRKQERLAAKFGNKCKVACKKPGQPMATTKAPPSGRLNFVNNLMQNKWRTN